MSEKRGENKQSAESLDTGSKKILGDSIQRKIAYYLTKSKIQDSDLYSVVKDFFNEMLDLKRVMTCKELKNELNKIYMDTITREKLEKFLDRVSLIEYKDDPYSDEDLRRLLHEFEYLVDSIIKASKKGEKKGFFSSMFGAKQKKEIKPEQIPNRGTDEILKSLEKTDVVIEKKKIEKNEDIPPAPSPSEEPKDEKTKKILEELANINTNDILPKDMDDTSWSDSFDLSKIAPSPENNNPQKEEIKPEKKEKPIKIKEEKKKNIEKTEENIDSLIKKAKKLKEKDELKEEYKKINKIYDTLNDEDKEKYFEEVHELYDLIKSLK